MAIPSLVSDVIAPLITGVASLFDAILSGMSSRSISLGLNIILVRTAMTFISPPIHFELTHKGDIRRFALSGTNDQILTAVRERVAATFGASEKQLNIGWKVRAGTSSLPLSTSDDLSRAIAQSTKSNDQCIKIVVDTAPITAKMLDLCCTLCDEPLEGEYIQCPSSSHHAFCFRCTTIFLWKHAKDQEIYCPSGEECRLDNRPWDFWDATIEEVLGDDYEDFVEVRAAAHEKIEEDEEPIESKEFVNPFECPTNGEVEELRERVRILEENEKMRNEREDNMIKRLNEMEMTLRTFVIKKENVEPLH